MSPLLRNPWNLRTPSVTADRAVQLATTVSTTAFSKITFATLVLVPMLLTPATRCEGARFELEDGTVLEGTYITEVEGRVHLYDKSGKIQIVERDNVLRVDWDVARDSSLERKAQRERKRMFEKREKLARKTLDAWLRAKDEPQAELLLELDRFSSAELANPLSKALCAGDEPLAQFALDRLGQGDDRRTLMALVRGSLVAQEPSTRDQAHHLAFDKNPGFTRQLYEYIVRSPAALEMRERALDRVVHIANRQSVPMLVQTLSSVDAQIRAYVVRTKEIKEVPVNLGSARQSAQNVTIDLPEAEILGVSVSTRVPLQDLRRVHSATAEALNSITGETYGSDIQAWAHWWRDYQARQQEKAIESPETPRTTETPRPE